MAIVWRLDASSLPSDKNGCYCIIIIRLSDFVCDILPPYWPEFPVGELEMMMMMIMMMILPAIPSETRNLVKVNNDTKENHSRFCFLNSKTVR